MPTPARIAQAKARQDILDFVEERALIPQQLNPLLNKYALAVRANALDEAAKAVGKLPR